MRIKVTGQITMIRMVIAWIWHVREREESKRNFRFLVCVLRQMVLPLSKITQVKEQDRGRESNELSLDCAKLEVLVEYQYGILCEHRCLNIRRQRWSAYRIFLIRGNYIVMIFQEELLLKEKRDQKRTQVKGSKLLCNCGPALRIMFWNA